MNSAFSFRIILPLLVLAIPFDKSALWSRVPALSLVDYLVAFASIPFLFHFRETFRVLVSTPWLRLIFGLWILFLIYLALTAFFLAGSYKPIFRYAEFLFVYFMAYLAALKASEREVHFLLKTLTVTGFVIAVWGLLQYSQSGGHYELTFATFKQHNSLAAFLSFCLPAAMICAKAASTRKTKMIWLLQAIVIGACFILGYSRGAWVGLVFSSFIYLLISFLKSWERIRLTSVLSFVLCVTGALIPLMLTHFLYESTSLPKSTRIGEGAYEQSRLFSASARPLYWRAAFNIFVDNPWFGIGPGRYASDLRSHLFGFEARLYDEEIQQKKKIDFWQNLHNAYLQKLAEYGIVGLILWSLAFSLMCRPLFAEPIQAWSPLIAFGVSAFAFCIHNAFDYLFVNSFDLLFAMTSAICAARLHLSSQSERIP